MHENIKEYTEESVAAKLEGSNWNLLDIGNKWNWADLWKFFLDNQRKCLKSI